MSFVGENEHANKTLLELERLTNSIIIINNNNNNLNNDEEKKDGIEVIQWEKYLATREEQEKYGIGDDGAFKLSSWMKKKIVKSKLKIMIISWNNITHVGVKAISDALSFNYKLKKLDLYGNYIGNQGIKELAKMLLVNTSLQILNLNRNEIGDESMKDLSDSLLINSTLQELSLWGNNISDNGAILILQSLLSNVTLTHLDLFRNNNISEKNKQHIEAKIKYNKERSVSFNGDSKNLLVNINDIELMSVISCNNVPISKLSPLIHHLQQQRKRPVACTNLLISSTPISQIKFSHSYFNLPSSAPSAFANITFLSLPDCDITNTSLLLNFKSVQKLILTNNKAIDSDSLMVNLPDLLFLQYLHINDCNLSDINIRQCQALVFLNISNNPISLIPKLSPNLQQLHAENCPFVDKLPIEAVQDSIAITNYCKDLQSPEAVYRSKLIVLGSGNIGKTTLVDTICPLTEELELRHSGYFTFWFKSACKLNRNTFIYDENHSINSELSLLDHNLEIDEVNDNTFYLKSKETSQIVLSLRTPNVESFETWTKAIKRQMKNEATDTVDIRPWKITREELLNAGMHETNDIPHIEATIWDFAGQGTYREGHQFFLSRRSVYLVMVDLDPFHKNDSSPENVGRVAAMTELRQWLTSLESLVGGEEDNDDGHIIIVGNKLDTLQKPSKDDSMMKRRKQVAKIIREAGITMSWEYNEISCKENIGIETVKNHIIFAMSEQHHMGELVPKECRDLKIKLTENKLFLTPPILHLPQIASMLKENEGFITRLLILLNFWSECIYFGNDDRLNNIVFLDPQWLTKQVIGALLFFLGGNVGDLSESAEKQDQNQQTGRDGSKVTIADLRQAWHGWCSKIEDEKKVNELIFKVALLLEKFSILFPRDNNGNNNNNNANDEITYFVPGALRIDSSKIASKRKWLSICQKVIKSTFLVTGLTGQLVGQLRKKGITVNADESWRSGLYCYKKDVSNSRLLLLLDSVRNEITIRVEMTTSVNNNDEYGNSLLDEGEDVVKATLSNYKGLKWEVKYCCPSCVISQTGNISFISNKSKEEIEQGKRKRGKDGVMCVGCDNGHDMEVFKWYADRSRTRCRFHGVNEHDFFISYRVASEGIESKGGNGLSHKIFEKLDGSGRVNDCCFLDSECLQVGEHWKEGFMHGITHSKLIILLISEGSLKILQKNEKEKKWDNVLLEWLIAIQMKQNADGVRIFPINVKQHKNDTFEYWSLPPNFFGNCEVKDLVPDEDLTKIDNLAKISTIRDVLNELKPVQSHTVIANDSESIEKCVKEIIKKLN